MKRYFAPLLILLVLGVVVFFSPLTRRYINQKACEGFRRSIKRDCPKCELTYASCWVSFANGNFALRSAHYKNDPSAVTEVDLKIKRLDLHFLPKSLLHDVAIIEKVQIDGLDITLTDDDKKPKAKV